MTDEQTTAASDQTATVDGTGAGQAPPATPTTEAPTTPRAGVTFTPEQQAHIDTLITGRLDRAKTKWAKDREVTAAKAKATADAEKLKAQGEWQKAAEVAEARVAELEQLTSQIEGYEVVVAELLETRIKDLDGSQAAIDALPEDMGKLAKLKWLNKNTDLFTKKPIPKADLDAGTQGVTDQPAATDEEVEEFAAKFGVSARYVDRRTLPPRS